MRRTLPILFPLVLMLTACAGSDSETPSDVGPEVLNVTPGDGSTDVGLLTPLVVQFSEAVDPSTLTPSSVHLGARTVDLHMELDEAGTTLQLLPELVYAGEAVLQLGLGEGITDLDGNSLEPFQMSFETGIHDCAHLTDRFEPNDEIAGATELELDRIYPALSVCALNRDYYRFSLDESAKITIRSHLDYLDGPLWRIVTLNGDGDWYASHGFSTGTGEEPETHYSFLPGQYWIMIYADDSSEVLYDLVLESGPADPDDEYEDNDFQDEARPLAEGLHEGLVGNFLDDDWYSIAVEEGQTLQVTVDVGDYGGARHLYVTDPGGVNSQGGTYSENPVSYAVPITATGTSFIDFQAYQDSVSYSLEIAIED